MRTSAKVTPSGPRATTPEPVPTATEPGAPLALEAGLGFRLGRAHRAVRAAWETRIADLGLSGPQASVLGAVVERPDMGLRELARRLGTDAMNAKRLADGLERAGLVESGADRADRRRRALRPTSTGRALGAELERLSAAWRRRLEAVLGPRDSARLRALLERIEAGVVALPDRDDLDHGGGPGHD